MTNKVKDLYQEVLRSCREGNIRILRSLISDFRQEVCWADCRCEGSGDGPLHVAARHGHFHILRYLIEEEHEDDMERVNLDGKRPLHEAAQAAHAECVQFLLQQGVKVDPLKRADWTPLMLACTKVNNLAVVKLLIESGSNPLLKNKDGWNCFHIACREGDVDIVSYLLSASTQVWDSVSKNGRTPLHTAALHGHAGVVSILLTHCSYPRNLADSCGCTPLMDAARAGHLEVLGMLATHRADINHVDSMGRNPLHCAAEAGATAVVEVLVLNYLMDVNKQAGKSEMTPLHWATKEGHLDTVKKLIELGANADLGDCQKRTALTMARYGRNPALIEYLEQVSNLGSYE